MRQALHIFGKDVRLMTYEIVVTMALLAAFAYYHVTNARISPDLPDPFITPLLVLAAWIMIVRLIHAETLTGTRPFWLTRPYPRASLLGAKILFFLIFLNLPKMVADIIILSFLKFPLTAILPGLLWSQLLLFCCFVLPIAAVAALTSNVVQAMSGSLLLALLLLPGSASFFGPASWIAHFGIALWVTLSAGILLALQYAIRRTRWLRLAGIASSVLIFGFSLSYSVQSRIAQMQLRGPQTAIGVNTAEGTTRKLRGNNQVQFPVQFTGIPDGMTPRVYGTQLRIFTEDGTAWPPLDQNPANFGLVQSEPELLFNVSPEFYQRLKAGPPAIRGTIYVTLLGNRAVADVRRTPAFVPGVGVCSLENIRRDSTQLGLVCLSAFRTPPRLVSAVGMPQLSYLLSYSPFPAELRISPLSGFGPTPLRDETAEVTTLTTLEPLAHFARDVNFTDLRFTETEAPSPTNDSSYIIR